MKTVKALVEKSEIVYPEPNKHGILEGIPLYETIFVIKENRKKQKFFFYNEFAYFDVGSKIDVVPTGTNIIIPNAQNEAPHPVNTFTRLGRKYPRTALCIFAGVLIWAIVLGFMRSLFSIFPVGLFWITSGIYSIINYFKIRKSITIKGTIKNIGIKSSGSGLNKYHYIYEYKYNSRNFLHVSFFSGATKRNIGKRIDLIYNTKNNIIIEKKKHKNLLISGLSSFFFGIIFIILLFIVK